MRLRYLHIVALALLLAATLGAHRQVHIVSPYTRSDDPATTTHELMQLHSLEVHLDEDEFNPAGCVGSGNPYSCCTGAGTGPTCNEASAFEIYDGANTLIVNFTEAGVYQVGGNDVVRGSNVNTWGPLYWTDAAATGDSICGNQGQTCKTSWDLGVGTVACNVTTVTTLKAVACY